MEPSIFFSAGVCWLPRRPRWNDIIPVRFRRMIRWGIHGFIHGFIHDFMVFINEKIWFFKVQVVALSCSLYGFHSRAGTVSPRNRIVQPQPACELERGHGQTSASKNMWSLEVELIVGLQDILLARLFRRNVEQQIGFCIRRSLEGLLFFFLISDKKIPAGEQKLRCCASIRFKLLVEQRFYSLYQHISTYINITQQYTVIYFYVLST